MSDASLDFSEFLPDLKPTPEAGTGRDTRSPAQKARHTLYARWYLVDGSHAKVCRRLGYEQERCPDSAFLRAEIQALQDKQAAKYAITPQNVLKEYARMAMFDIKKLTDEHGNPIAIQDLDDDTSAAIAGVEIMKLGKKDDFAQVLKYKAHGKQAALDALSKNLGLFKEDNEQVAKGNGLIDEMSQNELARRLAFFLQENLRKQVDGAKEA